jgi:hypothetical protein
VLSKEINKFFSFGGRQLSDFWRALMTPFCSDFLLD